MTSEQIREIAYEVVSRACGFAALAIFCFMTGMSFMPRFAFQTGGFLTTTMALTLVYKAHEARTRSHRRTELWLYLPEERRPEPETAQSMISSVMRETYLTFALWTAAIAITMWAIALVFSLAGL